jgi:hypothetical protein
MVQVMRRYIALVVACAVVTISLGCRHVGGKCDCGYNPADYPIPAQTNPYPAVPAIKPLPKVAPGQE